MSLWSTLNQSSITQQTQNVFKTILERFLFGKSGRNIHKTLKACFGITFCPEHSKTFSENVLGTFLTKRFFPNVRKMFLSRYHQDMFEYCDLKWLMILPYNIFGYILDETNKKGYGVMHLGQPRKECHKVALHSNWNFWTEQTSWKLKTVLLKMKSSWTWWAYNYITS